MPYIAFNADYFIQQMSDIQPLQPWKISNRRLSLLVFGILNQCLPIVGWKCSRYHPIFIYTGWVWWHLLLGFCHHDSYTFPIWIGRTLVCTNEEREERSWLLSRLVLSYQFAVRGGVALAMSHALAYAWTSALGIV